MSKFAIICVDDEQAMLDSLEIELNQVLEAKYLIETASDAEEALTLFEELRSDGYEIPLVIADYIMPNMKGDELLRRVHALSNRTLKIMLTGQATLEAMAYAIKYANLYRYISKPLESADFQLTIKEALNSYVQTRQLEQFYAELEAKVVERTKELHEKNAQLIALNQDKNEFLGIAAHDLKNPLSAIQGLSDIIARNFDNLSKEKIVNYANMVYISSRKMFELIKNLLDVNKIESGKITVNLEVVNLYSVAKELVDSYQERSKAKNITIHFQATESRYTILVDRNVIYQVLDNLISNAVKYTHLGSDIHIDLSQNETHVCCLIKDEGPGIAEQDLPKLFGKFTRLATKPTGGEHSTGLGLFIVKKLVDTMSGEVWCESEEGKGAMFAIKFPITKQAMPTYSSTY